MKRRTPGGIWALRGVTATITIIVIIVVASVAYSAYEDYSGFRAGTASGGNLISGSASYNQGTGAETISFNVTVPNRGLYPLNVTISCASLNPDVHCPAASADVSPGGEQVLHFQMTVDNVQQFLASSDHQVNGTVDMTLVPFASLSVGVNFTSFVQLPGGV